MDQLDGNLASGGAGSETAHDDIHAALRPTASKLKHRAGEFDIVSGTSVGAEVEFKKMSRLRSLLVWLVMAALPLQGWAAATMLFCGSGEQRTVTQSVAAPLTQASAHDHGMHSHADKPAEKNGDGGKQMPDGGHKCGVCASCCHGVAISGLPRLVASAAPAPIELAEPFVLIHTRTLQVPDKPPRA